MRKTTKKQFTKETAVGLWVYRLALIGLVGDEWYGLLDLWILFLIFLSNKQVLSLVLLQICILSEEFFAGSVSLYHFTCISLNSGIGMHNNDTDNLCQRLVHHVRTHSHNPSKPTGRCADRVIWNLNFVSTIVRHCQMSKTFRAAHVWQRCWCVRDGLAGSLLGAGKNVCLVCLFGLISHHLQTQLARV